MFWSCPPGRKQRETEKEGMVRNASCSPLGKSDVPGRRGL